MAAASTGEAVGLPYGGEPESVAVYWVWTCLNSCHFFLSGSGLDFVDCGGGGCFHCFGGGTPSPTFTRLPILLGLGSMMSAINNPSPISRSVVAAVAVVAKGVAAVHCKVFSRGTVRTVAAAVRVQVCSGARKIYS